MDKFKMILKSPDGKDVEHVFESWDEMVSFYEGMIEDPENHDAD